MPRLPSLRRPSALVAVALSLAVGAALAAAPVPVDAIAFSLSGAPRVERGAQSELSFVLSIAPGYAILSNRLEEGGLRAATVSFRTVNNIAVGQARFPKARSFKVGEKRYAAYEGSVKVRIPLTVSPNTLPGVRQLEGKLIYQVCDATQCFDPVQQRLALQLDIAP